jgi:hypothetical protein
MVRALGVLFSAFMTIKGKTQVANFRSAATGDQRKRDTTSWTEMVNEELSHVNQQPATSPAIYRSFFPI